MRFVIFVIFHDYRVTHKAARENNDYFGITYKNRETLVQKSRATCVSRPIGWEILF
jgi:hypothetical protein